MKHLFTLLLLTVPFAGLLPQCGGNLGENIFTEGDFGSGTVNIPPDDPMIAPGYNYTTLPPPNDGSYVITNNTTSWGSFASFWADIGDNSADPNGYMMVVNASFTPGLFYEQEVSGLCENTLYVFSADIFNLIAGPEWIKPNVSFLLDGNIEFETGDIPDNNQWITYGFTFTTGPGQTSVTLALANNAPGGNGNDLALDNISFRPCGPEALILPESVANICEDGDPLFLEATIIGDQYDNPVVQWQQSSDGGISWEDIPGANGLTLTFDNLAAGDYYYRYLLAGAPANLLNTRCRVVSNVKVVNVIPKFYTITDTLCRGLSFNLNGIEYDESGVYVDSLLTVLGCDSVVTLNLTIVDDPGLMANFTISDPICHGDATGCLALDTVINGTLPYAILINGSASASGNLTNQTAGVYRYVIQDRYQCSLDTSLVITEPSPFLIDLGEDRLLELGDELQLFALASEVMDTLIWSAVDSFDCVRDCSGVNLLPQASQTVFVTAFSQDDGCPATDSVRIRVINVQKVYIPNAFSPNNDGINDLFTVFGGVPNVRSIKLLRIFDRWGGLIYEEENFPPNSSSIGWNGTVGERDAPAGTYTYVSEVAFLDGRTVTYAGGVNLIR